MHSSDHTELFDHIYHNKADEATREAFKARLEADEQFRDEFRAYLLVNESVQEVSREEFRERFGTGQSKQKGAVIRSLWLRPMAKVAGIFLLISASFLTYNHFNYWNKVYATYPLIVDSSNLLGPKSPGAASHYITDPAELNYRAMVKGFEALKSETYTQAIDQFEKVKVLPNDEFDHYFIAQYNMALAHLKLGNKDQAKAILQPLSLRPENHHLKAKASQLLTTLEQPKFLFF